LHALQFRGMRVCSYLCLVSRLIPRILQLAAKGLYRISLRLQLLFDLVTRPSGDCNVGVQLLDPIGLLLRRGGGGMSLSLQVFASRVHPALQIAQSRVGPGLLLSRVSNVASIRVLLRSQPLNGRFGVFYVGLSLAIQISGDSIRASLQLLSLGVPSLLGICKVGRKALPVLLGSRTNVMQGGLGGGRGGVGGIQSLRP